MMSQPRGARLAALGRLDTGGAPEVDPVSRTATALKRLVVGRPTTSGEFEYTLLPKIIAHPVFSSGRPSSVTYATMASVRIDSRDGRGSIEAKIIDGAGRTVELRRAPAGVRLRLRLIGRKHAPHRRGGRTMIVDPEREPVPGPQHG